MFDAGKTRVIGLPYGEKNYDDILSRFHLTPGRHGRTDWQTDRQTELLYQYRASVCWRAIKIDSMFRLIDQCTIQRVDDHRAQAAGAARKNFQRKWITVTTKTIIVTTMNDNEKSLENCSSMLLADSSLLLAISYTLKRTVEKNVYTCCRPANRNSTVAL